EQCDPAPGSPATRPRAGRERGLHDSKDAHWRQSNLISTPRKEELQMSAPSGRRASKARPRGSTANVIAEPATATGVGTVARGSVEIEPEQIARLAYSYWEAR